MRILELSGDTGSTLVIAHALAEQWRAGGHRVDVLAPVGRFHLRAALQALCARPRYHLIHAHLGGAAMLARKLGAWLGIPVVATLHGFQKAKHYQGISHFTAVSSAVKAHYAPGLKAAEIQVIYNGYPPDMSNQTAPTYRERLNLSADTILLGAMGTLTPIKNHTMLLEAAAQLIQRDTRYHLALAGDGPHMHKLKAQAQQLGIDKHVHFLGFIHDRSAFYHGLDLFIQPSKEEGFCMPIIEAMACAVPVISTPSIGPEEYITHDYNGILLGDHSAGTCAQAIETLLSQPERIHALTSAAQETIAPWSWSHIAQQYEDYFRQVLS